MTRRGAMPPTMTGSTFDGCHKDHTPYFRCAECGLQTRHDDADGRCDLLNQLAAKSSAEVAKVQAQVTANKVQKREARKKSARQIEEDLREQHRQATDFLPPRPRAITKKRKPR